MVRLGAWRGVIESGDKGRRQLATGREFGGLTVALAVVFAAALAGGAATEVGLEGWYGSLKKPSWTPASWVFGPVWTVLYVMMAVAVWLVWKKGGVRGARRELWLFAAQLMLNAVWPLFFFGMGKPGAAFVELAVLWVAIAATMVAFFRVNVVAGALMAPYLGWVTFAGALNFAIWRLNA